jgi:cytochrome P450
MCKEYVNNVLLLRAKVTCASVCPGAKWHSRRKLITPTFHFKILDIFVEVFVEKSEILVKKLLPKVGGKGFDIYPFITLCALDIICGKLIICNLYKEEQDALYKLSYFLQKLRNKTHENSLTCFGHEIYGVSLQVHFL